MLDDSSYINSYTFIAENLEEPWEHIKLTVYDGDTEVNTVYVSFNLKNLAGFDDMTFVA